MAAPGLTTALIVASLIIVFGIIHLGVGAGIVGKYRHYSDIFQQPVGISSYDIVVGIYSMVVGALCVFTIVQQKVLLCRPALICSGVLGIVAIASLIAALILNAQAVSFMRARFLYRMNTYIDTQTSINIIDMVQSNWQCCGINSWLDYATVGLGTTTTETAGTGTVTDTGTVNGTDTVTGTGTGTGTGTVTGTGTSSGAGTAASKGAADPETRDNEQKSLLFLIGRRRRDLDLPSSPLVNAVRQRRQTSSSTGVYGLPSTYTFNLPFSCCISGAQTSGGNALGGYCVFSANNSTTSFYVQGCLATIANIAVAQITGIAVINTILFILAVIMIPLLINMFPNGFDAKDPNSKQALPYEGEQQQQMQNGGYYANNDPNAYYSYPQQPSFIQPVYITYQ